MLRSRRCATAYALRPVVARPATRPGQTRPRRPEKAPGRRRLAGAAAPRFLSAYALRLPLAPGRSAGRPGGSLTVASSLQRLASPQLRALRKRAAKTLRSRAHRGPLDSLSDAHPDRLALAPHVPAGIEATGDPPLQARLSPRSVGRGPARRADQATSPTPRPFPRACLAPPSSLGPPAQFAPQSSLSSARRRRGSDASAELNPENMCRQRRHRRTGSR